MLQIITSAGPDADIVAEVMLRGALARGGDSDPITITTNE